MPDTNITDIFGLGKSTDNAVDVAAKLVERLLGAAADAAGVAMAQPIQELHQRRVERGRAVLVGTSEMLGEAKLAARPVPGRILMPLLEQASVEEDPELAERWAALLARAAIGESVLPAFVDVMRQLTPMHARLFWTSCWTRRGQPTWGMRDNILGVQLSESGARISMSTELIYSADLHRMQLIDGRREVEKVGRTTGPSHYGKLGLTALGAEFLRACRAPSPGPAQAP